jgi:putative toxin-antitoxin system antitoxin component (TIGR02293 family)
MAKTATIKKAPSKGSKTRRVGSTHIHSDRVEVMSRMTINVAEMLREGYEPVIKGRHFEKILKNSPLGLNEWARVVYVTARTLRARIKDDRPFDPLQSDRVELIVQLMNKGEEVFGDPKRFRRWLEAPRPTLHGRKPIDLLGDLSGIGEVFAELGRIEHGVF